MKNIVIPRGYGYLITAAMRYLVTEQRNAGLEMTTGYHHNLDRPERVEAMRNYPFLDAYKAEIGVQKCEEPGFSLFRNATHPEEFFSLVVERIVGYNETIHPTGKGSERTENYSGIVLLRRPEGTCGNLTPLTRLRVKVRVEYAVNDNLWLISPTVTRLNQSEVISEE